jgi:hypothetical protein
MIDRQYRMIEFTIGSGVCPAESDMNQDGIAAGF